MEQLKRVVNHLLIICTLLLVSCGYVSDKAVQNADVYHSDNLETCKINVDELGEIFKTDQKQQIRCLEENFIQFAKYVRSKHPGSITEDELGIFVKRFFKDQSDSIIEGLSLIFQLNMILLKDEADRISHSNISPLFELLVQINQEAVIIVSIIKAMDEEKNQAKFWELRTKFVESTTRFSRSAIRIIEKSPGLAQKLNMRNFITQMNTRIGSGKIEPETIDSFIFLKRAFVGGDKEVITSDELKMIIGKLPNMLSAVFDVYYSKKSNFKSEAEELKFYLLSIRSIFALLQFDQPDFELVNSDQLVTIAKKFMKNYDVESFKPSIEVLKSKFIGGKKDSLTMQDLKVLMSMVVDFVEKMYFDHVTYNFPENKQILASPGAIAAFEKQDLDEYTLFDPTRVKGLHDSFADTVVSFRYFRNKKMGAPIYNQNISRSNYGVMEANLAKWMAVKLLKAYGHVDDKNERQLKMEEFSTFLLDAKPLLQEFKLWSPNFASFARNAVLLADLFQAQSNGDQQMNTNETAEYIIMLLTSVDVSGKMNDALSVLCDPGINPKDPVFEVECFNDNFYETLLNRLEYKKFFPRLSSYFSHASKEEMMNYLKGVQGFARDDNSPGLPINNRDAILTIGAMLNIESTFIRFDKNLDNIIDYDELSEAFFVYRDSIITLAKLKDDQKKYAKGIFLYMITKMEVPKMGSWIDDVRFITFNSCVQQSWCRGGFMDKIEAKRLNIGSLLYYMVNQGAFAPKNRKPQSPGNG